MKFRVTKNGEILYSQEFDPNEVNEKDEKTFLKVMEKLTNDGETVKKFTIVFEKGTSFGELNDLLHQSGEPSKMKEQIIELWPTKKV